MWFMLSYWLWPESKTSLRYCFLLAFCRSFSCFQILLFILSLKKTTKKKTQTQNPHMKICVSFLQKPFLLSTQKGLQNGLVLFFSLEEYSIVILLCLTLKDSLLPPQMGVTSLSRLAHFLCKSARSDIYAFFLWVCVTV